MEHYRRLKSIGKGTYGEAHLVQYLEDDRYYVMKKIDLSRLATKQRLQAEREVAILSQLHHPYIIHYKESFIHDNSLCIVTSYAEQGTIIITTTASNFIDTSMMMMIIGMAMLFLLSINPYTMSRLHLTRYDDDNNRSQVGNENEGMTHSGIINYTEEMIISIHSCNPNSRPLLHSR
jgi:hypothetical protein